MDRGILPRFEELDALVNSDDLLNTAGLDAGVVRPRTPPATSLAFLPSRHGSGCEATITGYWGQHEPDGWIAADYGGLRGIAIELDRDMLWQHAWLRTVVRRLRAQGVLFLTPAEARAYMASNEAAYWVWRDGGTALSRFVRRAAAAPAMANAAAGFAARPRADRPTGCRHAHRLSTGAGTARRAGLRASGMGKRNKVVVRCRDAQ